MCWLIYMVDECTKESGVCPDCIKEVIIQIDIIQFILYV